MKKLFIKTLLFCLIILPLNNTYATMKITTSVSSAKEVSSNTNLKKQGEIKIWNQITQVKGEKVDKSKALEIIKKANDNFNSKAYTLNSYYISESQDIEKANFFRDGLIYIDVPKNRLYIQKSQTNLSIKDNGFQETYLVDSAYLSKDVNSQNFFKTKVNFDLKSLQFNKNTLDASSFDTWELIKTESGFSLQSKDNATDMTFRLLMPCFNFLTSGNNRQNDPIRFFVEMDNNSNIVKVGATTKAKYKQGDVYEFNGLEIKEGIDEKVFDKFTELEKNALTR